MNIPIETNHAQGQAERLINALAKLDIHAELLESSHHGFWYNKHTLTVSQKLLEDDYNLFREQLADLLHIEVAGVDIHYGKDNTIDIILQKEEKNVSFWRLANGERFKHSSYTLPIVLGKEPIELSQQFADLHKMPHFLIAGQKGTGKTSLIHSIILSLALKLKSSEVHFLLIDLDESKLGIYDYKLPHLIDGQVIKHLRNAKNALLWAVDEMERRFALLEDFSVTTLDSYNKKIEELSTPQALPTELCIEPYERYYHAHIPYLVLVLDEYSVLIHNYPKEFKQTFEELATKAHEVGMHLVMSTSEISENTLCEDIKALFPNRIAFQAEDEAESQMILDCSGAEKLYEAGDFLIKQEEQGMRHVDGAYVEQSSIYSKINSLFPDDEEGITKSQRQSYEYKLDLDKYNSISLYDEALSLLPHMEKFSCRALQKLLNINLYEAVFLMERLENAGYITTSIAKEKFSKRSTTKKE